MKTDVAKIAAGEKTNLKNVEERNLVQGARRSLHPLQKAAGDKENLVGGGRVGIEMPPNKERLVSAPTNTSESVSAKKQKTSRTVSDSRGISVEDLTSQDTPSTSYYQQLCEKQSLALNAALNENKELHERVKLLEEENEQCRIMLEETKALVETLKEMMYDPDDDTSEEDSEECPEKKGW